MALYEKSTHPIAGQKPGTSGLRKKTRQFMEPGFLENYVQAIIDAIDGATGKTFVIGGDGRFFNIEAIGTILQMLAANGAKAAIVGQNGLLSTPAASHLIRKRKTDGGFILSASHNPGGIDADFGLKFNAANGGPAPEWLTEKIFERTADISVYRQLDEPTPDISVIASHKLGSMDVEVTDPVADYADLMESLFDFQAIRALFSSGFRMTFDAMHAATGPYAHEILENRLGAPLGTVLNGVPSVDFGGGHPDPNPIWAKPLMDTMYGDDAPDFGAASDGDGDRNMIVGAHAYVTPSDSLAVLAANAHLAPAYNAGLSGIARSMPTSAAVDRVAEKQGIACYETPTGWKFFGTLLDDDKVTLCGEESAGTGSDHVREKDGLWAVLLWLNILAVRKQPVADIMREHWSSFGRNFYSRHDYEAIDTEAAHALMQKLREQLDDLPGKTIEGQNVSEAGEFSYTDPVDGSYVSGQGIFVRFHSGARIVYRLSGTGTDGATLRVYLEQLEMSEDRMADEPASALAPIIRIADQLANIRELTGRIEPDVIT